MTCPRCLGEGWIVGHVSTIGCCQSPNKDGSCCGNAVEVFEVGQVECPICALPSVAERAAAIAEHYRYDELDATDFVMSARDGVPLRDPQEMELPF